jgi:hypothetical protein
VKPRHYVDVQKARFQLRTASGVPEVVIPASRNWFVLIFLGFWIFVWTIGGVAALGQIIQSFDAFLLVWLCAWAAGWAFAAATLAWQINGSETLRIVGGDLEVRHSAMGISRSWWFRGSEIKALKASDRPSFPFGWGFDAPLLFWRRWGAVKYQYGARTVYLAAALDEAEGELIVAELAKYLPRAVEQRENPV